MDFPHTGGLYLSYVAFVEPKAAAQSAMVLVIFCLGVPLLPGDSLSVILPGFSFNDQQFVTNVTPAKKGLNACKALLPNETVCEPTSGNASLVLLY